MKKLIWSLFGLVALLLATALILPLFLEAKAGDLVRREADRRLDARVDFAELNLSLLRHFPHASLELLDLTVVGTEAFEGDTLLAARRVSVVVDLLSLLGDRGFEVTKIELTEPKANAHKLADGSVNWDIVRTDPAAAAASTDLPGDDTSAEPSGSGFRLDVREVRISDAQLSYRNDSTGMSASVAPLDLRLQGALSGSAADLKLKVQAEGLNFSSGIDYLQNARLDADLRIAADFEARRFELQRNRIALNSVELSLDGWAVALEQGIRMQLDADFAKVGFRDLLSLLPGAYRRDLRASGELSLSLHAEGLLTEDTLPAFDARLSVSNGEVRYTALPGKIERIGIRASATNPGGTFDSTVLDIEEFACTISENPLRASLRVTTPASDPVISLRLDGRADLKSLSQIIPSLSQTLTEGVITAEAAIDGHVGDVAERRYDRLEASGSLVAERIKLTAAGLPVTVERISAGIAPAALTLGELRMQIGRSDLSARGQINDYLAYLLRDGMLKGRLYVDSKLLDLNQITESLATAGQEPTDEPAQPAADASAHAIAIPANLDLQLTARCDSLLLGKIRATGIEGVVALRRSALWLDGLQLGLFGGKAQASGSYSTADSSQQPLFKAALKLTGASFAQTFDQLEAVQRLVPLFEKTQGDYSLALDLSTRLDAQMSAELNTLDASGELRSGNLKLSNVKAFEVLAKTMGMSDMERFDSRQVAVRFTIADGRLRTDPFDIRLGGAEVNLSGTTGLDRTIDYTAKIRLPASVAGVQRLNVTIGGTFDNPRIALGLKETVEQAVAEVVSGQIEKLTGSQSVAEEVAKQAQRLREQAQKAGDKLVEAARQQRQKLIDGAKSPLARAAAEKAGDKLVKEARSQADRLLAEAEQQIARLDGAGSAQ